MIYSIAETAKANNLKAYGRYRPQLPRRFVHFSFTAK